MKITLWLLAGAAILFAVWIMLYGGMPARALQSEAQQAARLMASCPVSISLQTQTKRDFSHPINGATMQADIAFSVDGGAEKTHWIVPDISVRQVEADQCSPPFAAQRKDRLYCMTAAWRVTHGTRMQMIDHNITYNVELTGHYFAALVLKFNASKLPTNARLRVSLPDEIGMRVRTGDKIGEGSWQFPFLATGWMTYDLCDLAPLLRLREVILSVAAGAAVPAAQ